MDALCGLDVGFLQPCTAVLLYEPCSLTDPRVSSSSQSPPYPHPRGVSFRLVQAGHSHHQRSILEGIYLRGGCLHLLPPSWRAQLMVLFAS